VAAANVRVRRAYEEPEADDGTRVLVDRLWPRGLSKARAALDEWCKNVAPSPELRTWYSHDPDRFAEFSHRYQQELHDPDLGEEQRQVGDGADVPHELRLPDRDRVKALVVPDRAAGPGRHPAPAQHLLGRDAGEHLGRPLQGGRGGGVAPR
jgi:uncharacterized protein YeaO (DUF488 family)